MQNKPLILITNDDGIKAKGISELIDTAKEYGDIVVVAPDKGNSGKSHSVTFTEPLYLTHISENNGITKYTCSGTPVDSVKMAIHQVLKRKPDLIVSGINHGSNASISVIYSGTMAAAIEGCMNGIPSVGFSLLDFRSDADFSIARHYAAKIINQVLKNGLPFGTCLNVNIPSIPTNESKGIKICRQTNGVWNEIFEERKHPFGTSYFWLTGSFQNHEPEAKDTDEWALKNNYVAIVPIKIDLTSYDALDIINSWEF